MNRRKTRFFFFFVFISSGEKSLRLAVCVLGKTPRAIGGWKFLGVYYRRGGRQ